MNEEAAWLGVEVVGREGYDENDQLPKSKQKIKHYQ